MSIANFLLPMLAFAGVSLYTFNFLSRNFGWEAKQSEVSRMDVAKWSIYGAIVPFWIELTVILSFKDVLFSTAISIAAGIFLPLLYSAFRTRGIPFFPVPVIITAAAFTAFLHLYTPPPPENWSEYFDIGMRAEEFLQFYLWTSPPWIVGFAYARVNPRRNSALIPVIFIAYLVSTILMLPFFSRAGFLITNAIIYSTTLAVLAAIIWRVGR
ncbi:hypothetical protein Ferp_0330 [Ferroglobus placidus DSM 10642]|uniref:Uncharacterized protein n=1 Tax=Ferroglobus placidus (strain DSM 10642 / AEDII12DO) TaxID=589924 RepID=D3S2H9_FERPA|nr:hypothetical protein [Ferroglobus placidus]ADC64509.1 hypothetical protein Ferp_0330 [Ferroglobus placidus DSM 10642]